MPERKIDISDIPAVIQAMLGALQSCADRKVIPSDAFRGLDNQARRVLTAIAGGLLTTDVLVVISGGVCQSIHANCPELLGRAILRDFDVEGSEFDEANAGELFDIDGTSAREVVFPVDSFAGLDIQPFAKRVTPKEMQGRSDGM